MSEMIENRSDCVGYSCPLRTTSKILGFILSVSMVDIYSIPWEVLGIGWRIFIPVHRNVTNFHGRNIIHPIVTTLFSWLIFRPVRRNCTAFYGLYISHSRGKG